MGRPPRSSRAPQTGLRTTGTTDAAGSTRCSIASRLAGSCLLIEAQRRALEAVRSLAVVRAPGARSSIRALMVRQGLAEREYDVALHNLRISARVALHFHPERLDRSRRSVAQGLLDDGIYRNQYVTGLSSGIHRHSQAESAMAGKNVSSVGRTTDATRHSKIDPSTVRSIYSAIPMDLLQDSDPAICCSNRK
jgi:hypothetical protein